MRSQGRARSAGPALGNVTRAHGIYRYWETPAQSDGERRSHRSRREGKARVPGAQTVDAEDEWQTLARLDAGSSTRSMRTTSASGI